MSDYSKYRPPDTRRTRSRRFAVGLLLAVLFASASVSSYLFLSGTRESAELPSVSAARIADAVSTNSSTQDVGIFNRDAISFSKHIAPIVFEHCVECHRQGEAAPFELLSYDDVQTRADQIVEVIESRFMPPWLPEPEYGKFVGERRLADDQIELIRQWVEQGTVRGDPSDLPPLPQFTDGWRMGEPDLVVQLPSVYTLPSEGTDVFRNFVIPIPVDSPRYVRSVELRPGNKKVVHHANMLIDRSGESRRIDERDAEPGFDGMETVGQAYFPSGHLLSWKPGTPPYLGREDKSWQLEAGTDLVVNMHMLPTGKPEALQPTVGLYFTDQPPTPPAFELVRLENDGAIDIPAGEKEFVITDQFRLPVDVEVFRVYPHAHLLGKDLQGFATLPDGSKKWLFWIKDWDWNWQAVYRYVKPFPLPKGTVLSMRYTYDNSDENVRNPNNPPRRVVAGNRTADEMAHMWVQVLPRTEEDRHVLTESRARHQLEKYPHTVAARYVLGTVLQVQRRPDEAIQEFRHVLRINPDHPQAHFELARTLQMQGELDDAVHHFRRHLELKPDNVNAHYFLGQTLLSKRRLDQALRHFRWAVELKPDFFGAHLAMGTVLAEQNHLDQAIESWRRAVEIQPDYVEAHYNLGMALNNMDRADEALKHFREATRYRPQWAEPWNSIARILTFHPDLRDLQQAVEHARRAVQLSQNRDARMLQTLAAAYAADGDIARAVSTAEKAMKIASSQDDHQSAIQIRAQLKQYRAQRTLNSAQSVTGF